MSVAQILQGKEGAVITITPSAPLIEAVTLLAQKRIGAVVVVDESESLCGVLSERDIIKAMAAEGRTCLDHSVQAYMTKTVETCVPDEDVNMIMRRMTEGRFRHMPVLEEGKLVGMISIGDVVKNRISILETETSAMRDYIMMA